MKVSVLQQFLQNLIAPLESSAASAQTIVGLKRACQGFEPFRDNEVGEFAEFLSRAADYERDGKWPSFNPPIAGRILDEPSAREYAQRLRTFLDREAPSGSPLSDGVREELNRIAKRWKPAQFKEMARELQVDEDFRTAKQGLEKIVLRLTGQSLNGKKATSSSRKRAANADPAAIQQYAAELRNLAGGAGLEPRLEELVKQLSVADLRALAESVGSAPGKTRAKAALSKIILSALMAPRGQQTDPEDGKIARWAEIVAALKAKADGPDAPHDEIEAELRSLEGHMDRDEAIAVAKRIGIIRHLNSRNEAVEEIRRKVFEMKRARESIAY